MRRLFLAAPVLLALGACQTVRAMFDDDEHPLSEASRANAPLYLDLAEQQMESGELERAVERLIAVREVSSLAPADRLRSEELIDRCASLLLERADGPEADVEQIEELWTLDLSPRMRARAGIRYAERLLEEGRRIDAFKQVRDVESELPSHPERARAGAVLAEAGLSLIRDPDRYWLILRYQSRGIAALDYLVSTYPLDPACPQAYAALAEAYEERDELEDAIESREDLVLYHPASPEALVSEAEIPRLRMDNLDASDFDRGELVRALGELDAWLKRHPESELLEEVKASRARCEAMLSDSDAYLARYYRRVGSDFGARMHAERALQEAGASGDGEREERARSLLEDLPPARPTDPGSASAAPETVEGAVKDSDQR